MTLRQSFIAAYFFLDMYYEETKNDDFLDIISGMNPFLWATGGSADPAAEYDWADVAKTVTNEKVLTKEQGFQIMYNYVEFFITEFGFDFNWILNGLSKKTSNSHDWQKCIDAAMNVNETM